MPQGYKDRKRSNANNSTGRPHRRQRAQNVSASKRCNSLMPDSAHMLLPFPGLRCCCHLVQAAASGQACAVCRLQDTASSRTSAHRQGVGAPKHAASPMVYPLVASAILHALTRSLTHMQVQTDGRKTPEGAVSEALLSLHEEFTDIRNQFEVGVPNSYLSTVCRLIHMVPDDLGSEWSLCSPTDASQCRATATGPGLLMHR